jgi:SulP family sulfate permease
VRAFTVVPTRSGVLRDLREREILDLFSARLAAVSLSGYIFFGSSVSISDQARTACINAYAHTASGSCNND